jgi:hypothetical protein
MSTEDSPTHIIVEPLSDRYAMETRASAETDLWGGQGVGYVRGDIHAKATTELLAALNELTRLRRVEKDHLQLKASGAHVAKLAMNAEGWKADAQLMAYALNGITEALTAYADGLDPEDCIGRVIAETDNTAVARTRRRY